MNEWPESIYTLTQDCIISRDWGELDQGYPASLEDWVSLSFNLNHPMNPNNMILQNFKYNTHNNHWPTNVRVLDASTIINPQMERTKPFPDDPNNINDWVCRTFRSKDNDSNWTAVLSWWTVYHAIFRWENANPQEYLKLTHPNALKVAYWNDRIKVRYNTTWAYFGYTENQSQIAINISSYLHSPEGHAQLTAVKTNVRVNQYGVYTDRDPDDKPYYKRKSGFNPNTHKKVIINGEEVIVSKDYKPPVKTFKI